MEKIKSDYNIEIEQPAEPNFEKIDEVCLSGLLRQEPSPDIESAMLEVHSLRSSQFRVASNVQDGIVGLIYFTIPESGGFIHIDFITSLISGYGIGGLLIADLAELARSYNIPALKLEVSSIDEKVKAFYTKLGFIKSGSIHKSIDLDEMELVL